MHVVGFVCTTNRTLSPMAALVVGTRLARDGHDGLADMTSFGVDVPAGARLADHAEVVLAMHGYPTAHNPTEYDDFAEALARIEDAVPDLVDWMERTHWWT